MPNSSDCVSNGERPRKLTQGDFCGIALQGIEHWLTAANYSFRVMTFLRPTDLAPQGIAKLVHTIQSLLGPLFIGLFALAIRQRLKR